MTFKISSEAASDLEKIWLYTFENWSLQQADRYINLIPDEIEYSGDHTEAGKDFSHIKKENGKMVRSLLIVLKVNLAEQRVRVLRNSIK